MPKLTATDRVLIAMLTENTGRAMMDSGDAYGRNWQRNQGRDFLAEPASALAVRTCDWREQRAEIEVCHNVFHWLRDRLDYEPHKTAAFKRFANHPTRKDAGWLEIMDEWASKHSDGDELPSTCNTYNGEDLVSQTLQYTLYTDKVDDCEYVLLQIHGGCDVRGGYTAPRIFRVMDGGAMWDNACATIWEDHDPSDQIALPGLGSEQANSYWCTDDGCHWYREGSCGLGALPQLETYEVSTDPVDKGNGKIFLDADGIAYGPIHGGRLHAGF